MVKHVLLPLKGQIITRCFILVHSLYIVYFYIIFTFAVNLGDVFFR